MASTMTMTSSEETELKSLVNFRQLTGTTLYRSARPDKITLKDVEKFHNLGINSIIDLRSLSEYPRSKGPKLLEDYMVPIYAYPKFQKKGTPPNVEYKGIKRRGTATTESTSEVPRQPSMGVHFIVDLISFEYGVNVYKRAGFLMKILLALLYIFDMICQTRFFKKSLVRYVINNEGLYGQYRDIIRYAGIKVYTALKLLAEPQNTPALICCAYGKNRTGVIVAVLLRLLGWSKHDISKDYAKSAEWMEALKAELHGTLGYYSLNSSFATADSATMHQILDFIDEQYGSVEQYLESIGINRDLQQQIITNLTCR